MFEQGANLTLREALLQIGEIRAQLAEVTLFRGYRALTVGATGLLAILAALAQSLLIPEPGRQGVSFVIYWSGLAGVCLAMVGIQLAERYRATDSEFVRRDILQAVEKFAPSVLAGGLLTLAVVRFAPVGIPLLPGLWAMLFSLGVFASWRKLPRPSLLVGTFYLLAGTVLIGAADNMQSLSPYGMGITFGAGQLATAALLYFRLERKHAPTE